MLWKQEHILVKSSEFRYTYILHIHIACMHSNCYASCRYICHPPSQLACSLLAPAVLIYLEIHLPGLGLLPEQQSLQPETLSVQSVIITKAWSSLVHDVIIVGRTLIVVVIICLCGWLACHPGCQYNIWNTINYSNHSHTRMRNGIYANIALPSKRYIPVYLQKQCHGGRSPKCKRRIELRS
jgi:hypothetical protein